MGTIAYHGDNAAVETHALVCGDDDKNRPPASGHSYRLCDAGVLFAASVLGPTRRRGFASGAAKGMTYKFGKAKPDASTRNAFRGAGGVSAERALRPSTAEQTRAQRATGQASYPPIS